MYNRMCECSNEIQRQIDVDIKESEENGVATHVEGNVCMAELVNWLGDIGGSWQLTYSDAEEVYKIEVRCGKMRTFHMEDKSCDTVLLRAWMGIKHMKVWNGNISEWEKVDKI